MNSELIPHSKDLGDGVVIKRYLPHKPRPKVGPFVFFDYLEEIQFSAGTGTDVRPHPHIGLSTLSYLFSGRMHHCDSLGYDIILEPGDVLLMTSGKGIVHSERTPESDRIAAHSIHMVQFWLALPQSHEQMEPCIGHATESILPQWESQKGLKVKLALGSAFSEKAPVSTHLNAFLVDFKSSESDSYILPTDSRESALFLVSGSLKIDQETFSGPAFVVLESNKEIEIEYAKDCHWLWLGGDPLDGERHIWWNLVASRPELIEAAKEKWRKGEFEMVIGDDEFIPLPEN
jgi:redox-sensitive bicupin YhaK (pirin superfamily)